MSSRRHALTAALVASLVLIPVFLAIGADEGELLRQIKNDVFDQKWDAVLASCDQLISQFSRSQALPRAYYYRAQAMEHIRGKEEQAIAAYGDFLKRFPSESGALKEDALLSRMTLAASQWLKGNRKYVSIIMEGMDEKGYPRIYAAIQASKIDHAPARAKALSILKECVRTEADEELKNECILGVLRIDPTELTPPATPADGTTRARGSQAKLIRVEVFDKANKKVAVRVNMPVAFAELLLQSLAQEVQDEINRELQTKGISLQRIFDAFKGGGKQTIVEIDDDKHHIKVWVE